MDHSASKSDIDRRTARRHNLRTPLRIRVRRSELGEHKAESENLSQRGVFFTTDLPLTKGAALDLLLDMPEEVTGVPSAQWLCTGHVVRVTLTEHLEGKRGIGVQFDYYEPSRGRRPQWGMGVGLRGPYVARGEYTLRKELVVKKGRITAVASSDTLPSSRGGVTNAGDPQGHVGVHGRDEFSALFSNTPMR
jgi:hypothetical protein